MSPLRGAPAIPAKTPVNILAEKSPAANRAQPPQVQQPGSAIANNYHYRQKEEANKRLVEDDKAAQQLAQLKAQREAREKAARDNYERERKEKQKRDMDKLV